MSLLRALTHAWKVILSTHLVKLAPNEPFQTRPFTLNRLHPGLPGRLRRQAENMTLPFEDGT